MSGRERHEAPGMDARPHDAPTGRDRTSPLGGRGPAGSAREGRPQRLFRRSNVSSAWITFGLLGAVLGAWETSVAVGALDGRFLPPPSRVASGIIALSGESAVRTALAQTAYALAVSFAIGTAVGLLIGMLLGMNRLLRDAFLPLVIQLLGIPKSVFLPLFILAFGLGHGPGIAFGVLLSSIQVIINVVGAIDSIDTVHYQVARAYGASRFSTFRNVILPGAAPGIFAGMWHGIRNAFVGVVVAQLFVSSIGVGYLVRSYTATFRIADALALIFFVAFVVILVGNAWGVLERRISRWREPLGG